MRVRTRFAPSPTGYMHIGNLRSALYTYLIARHSGGDFILRIEDTDQARYVPGAIDVIYESLRVAGLTHDEGPDVGGPVGPYVQSERRDIYRDHALKLVEKGEAYYCFCTKERLEALHREADENGDLHYKYDKHCLCLPPEEVQARIAAGEPWVIRQNIPQTGQTDFCCAVYGDITVDNATLDDQVLLKSDGMPTYNFANVVDDHLMAITHVLRGNEYLSSCPKYNRLYQAFGWEPPVTVHLPLIVKEGGRKLSKREGDVSFRDFLDKGYLPEAIVNYIALLGWSPGDNREFFTLPEMVAAFTIGGISKSQAVFDVEKLTWFNAEYIRRLSPERFHELALPYLKQALDTDRFDTRRLAELLQPRCQVLPDAAAQVGFLAAMPDYDLALYENKKMKTDAASSLTVLRAVLPVLEGIDPWGEEEVKQAVSDYIAEYGLKNGAVLWPLRIAIAGQQNTPGGAYEIAGLLGREETLSRLRRSIGRLATAVG